ncbi:MFS transporter [Lachnospiraceae bacterium LCP25S3_G4]
MKKIPKRYVILVIATLVNFVHGCAYIWTVFQPYVKLEYGLSTAQSSQPFTVIIGVFALGNMLGGWLQHKIGSKYTVIFGSGLMCAGFLLAAFAPIQNPWMLTVGYGLLGGIGSGCAYSMLVAIPQAWFPDKLGMVTGITIGVVGISGVIMNPICDWMLHLYGYRTAMLCVTIFYAVLSFSGGWFIVGPSNEQMKTYQIQTKKQNQNTSEQRQFTTKEMVGTTSYYLISCSMALAVPAYVLVNPLMKSLGMERGLSDEVALLGVLIASVANIMGRFAAPYLSDKVGRKQMLLGLYAITILSVIGVGVAKGSLFILLITLVSFTYGGFVGVYPALTVDYFGTKYQGMNFGAVMIGYGVISMLCPYIISLAEHTAMGTKLSFIIAGVVSVIGIVITLKINKNLDNN